VIESLSKGTLAELRAAHGDMKETREALVRFFTRGVKGGLQLEELVQILFVEPTEKTSLVARVGYRRDEAQFIINMVQAFSLTEIGISSDDHPALRTTVSSVLTDASKPPVITEREPEVEAGGPEARRRVDSAEAIRKKRLHDFIFALIVRLLCGAVIGGLAGVLFGWKILLKSAGRGESDYVVWWFVAWTLGGAVVAVARIPYWQRPWYRGERDDAEKHGTVSGERPDR
jgi:hypothetical protein